MIYSLPIKIHEFVKKCRKSNSIMNEDNERVSDCETYYKT